MPFRDRPERAVVARVRDAGVGGRTIVAQITQRELPATATLSRTVRANREIVPGSSFVPALTTITRGRAEPRLRSAPGTSAAWRLISVSLRTAQPER